MAHGAWRVGSILLAAGLGQGARTGETADGFRPLFDRQHPHDLFMEIAALYRWRFGGFTPFRRRSASRPSDPPRPAPRFGPRGPQRADRRP